MTDAEYLREVAKQAVQPGPISARLFAIADRIEAAERDAERLVLRLTAIANWRERSNAYDADMGYKEQRTYCEDVSLIEQAAQYAIDAATKAKP